MKKELKITSDNVDLLKSISNKLFYIKDAIYLWKNGSYIK